MSSIQRITAGGTTYALFVHGKPAVDPIKFLTEPDDDMQLGVMERPKGHQVKAHTHPPVDRNLITTSEFLYIEHGKVSVQVFDNDWRQIADEVLETGDYLVFFRGGHALTMLEPTRMIEVKQGPYEGDNAAKEFKTP